MIVSDLRKLNPNYSQDYQSVAFFSGHRKPETDEDKIQALIQKWTTATASLSDWINIGAVDLDAIIAAVNLDEHQLLAIKEHQKELYDLWQKMYFQQHYFSNFKKVFEITPAFASEYAKLQLTLITRLLKGIDITENSSEPRQLSHKRDVDYAALLKEFNKGATPSYNIYSLTKDVWLHQILHYKDFLEQFIKDPVIEETSIESDPDDFSLAVLYPETISLLSKFTIEYSFTNHNFKEETYTEYEIQKVNGNDTEGGYRSALKKCYKKEYTTMLHKLRSIDKSEWENYFEELVGELHELRQQILTSEVYKQEEGEYSDERLFKYTRVQQVAFIGKADTWLSFNQSETSTYRYLVKLAEPYALVVSETIDALIGKLEGTGNYLDLLDFAIEVAAENSSQAISFDYKQKNIQPENITNFYNALKDALLIESTTNIGAFKSAFTGRKVNKKIVWINHIGKLKYLITQLHNEKEKVEPLGKKLWKTACYCFERSGGIQFQPDQLRQSKTPADTVALDRILNNL